MRVLSLGNTALMAGTYLSRGSKARRLKPLFSLEVMRRLRLRPATRLELAAIELSEEKTWAVRFLVVAVAALYLITFGLLLAIFALVLWASESNRPAILAGFAAAFVILGGGAGFPSQSPVAPTPSRSARRSFADSTTCNATR